MSAMSRGVDATSGGELDARAARQLLEVERFEPPAEFREQALLNDPEVYERAAADPQAWWAEQAERARLVRAVGHGARRLQPAVLQVVHRAAS